MKKHLLVSVALLVGSNAFAFPTVLDKVLVKEIRQTVNLMPVVDPGERPTRTRLEVEVISGGCTKARDFEIKANEENGKQTVQIFRIRPDLCEMTPHPITVTLETEKTLDVDHVETSIANPLLGRVQIVH